jgi:hypothetical protein
LRKRLGTLLVVGEGVEVSYGLTEFCMRPLAKRRDAEEKN